MSAALAALTIGAWFAYSALTGKSLTDVFKDDGGGKSQDPAGRVDAGAAAVAVPGVGDAAAGSGEGGGVARMNAEQNRMIGAHLAYKWGGGHAKFDAAGPWDCSGAVSWIAHYMGLLNGHPLTSTGFMTQGQAGRGSVFTIYANPTHVFIKMEKGQYAGQCWGTTSRSPLQGGSLQWHDHTTVGFVARHYPGW